MLNYPVYLPLEVGLCRKSLQVFKFGKFVWADQRYTVRQQLRDNHCPFREDMGIRAFAGGKLVLH